MPDFRKYILKYYIYFFFLFFALVGLFVVVKSRHETLDYSSFSQAENYNGGWYYYDENGESHSVPKLPAVIPSNTPTTRLYHSYSSMYPQEICFYTHHQTGSLSLNGKELYKYEIKGNPSWLADYKSFYHIVKLPPAGNAELCISLTPVGKKYVGEYDSIYLGTYQEIITRILFERLDKLILGIILMLISIICFFLSNIYRRNFSDDKTLLHLGFIGFFFGLWMLEESRLLQFVILNQGVHWCIEYLNQHFILLSAFLFVKDVYVPSQKKPTVILLGSSLVASVIVTVLQFANIVQLYNSMFILQLFSVVFCAYITYLVNIGNFFHQTKRLFWFNFFMFLSVLIFVPMILRVFNETYSTYFLSVAIIFMFVSFLLIGNQKTIDKYEAVQQAMLYHKLAFVDFNTGVASKTAWFSLIEKFDLEKSNMINCCLMLFDMNNLKKLNDTKGHLFGDKVINTFCSCLTKAFEKDGTVFRIGGDEFICFCRHSTEDEVEKMLKEFEILEASYKGTELEFSCAYGYVFFTPHSKEDFAEAQQRADSLMYEKKRRMKVGREFG